MTNHVHLLLTPRAPGGIARLMQSVAARYVWHVNARRDRTGTLWEGRYKACLVARDEHILAACRYIDLNPVRAGMVEHPSEYRWSSYAALSEERHDPLVTPHDTLLALGLPRGPAYERWCAQGGNDEATRQLREATGRELAFGPDSFKSEIEALTMRPASAKKRGRRSHRESPPS